VTASILVQPRHCTYRNTYSRLRLLQVPLTATSIAMESTFPRDTFSAFWTPAGACGHGCIKLRVPKGKAVAEFVTGGKGNLTERLFFTVTTNIIQNKELAKLLYSVSETAQLLSCSRNTVYSLMKSGQILAVYPTSKARIPATSLIRFVKSKEDEARAEQLAQGRLVR